MYHKCGEPNQALLVWSDLQAKHIQPNAIAYIAILAACAAVGPHALQVGKYILHIFDFEESVFFCLFLLFWYYSFLYYFILFVAFHFTFLPIYSQIVSSEFPIDNKVGNSLLNMFVKCGSHDDGICLWEFLKHVKSMK
jgi:hypothetical protein